MVGVPSFDRLTGPITNTIDMIEHKRGEARDPTNAEMQIMKQQIQAAFRQTFVGKSHF